MAEAERRLGRPGTIDKDTDGYGSGGGRAAGSAGSGGRSDRFVPKSRPAPITDNASLSLMDPDCCLEVHHRLLKQVEASTDRLGRFIHDMQECIVHVTSRCAALEAEVASLAGERRWTPRREDAVQASSASHQTVGGEVMDQLGLSLKADIDSLKGEIKVVQEKHEQLHQQQAKAAAAAESSDLRAELRESAALATAAVEQLLRLHHRDGGPTVLPREDMTEDELQRVMDRIFESEASISGRDRLDSLHRTVADVQAALGNIMRELKAGEADNTSLSLRLDMVEQGLTQVAASVRSTKDGVALVEQPCVTEAVTTRLTCAENNVYWLTKALREVQATLQRLGVVDGDDTDSSSSLWHCLSNRAGSPSIDAIRTVVATAVQAEIQVSGCVEHMTCIETRLATELEALTAEVHALRSKVTDGCRMISPSGQRSTPTKCEEDEEDDASGVFASRGDFFLNVRALFQNVTSHLRSELEAVQAEVRALKQKNGSAPGIQEVAAQLRQMFQEAMTNFGTERKSFRGDVGVARAAANSESGDLMRNLALQLERVETLVAEVWTGRADMGGGGGDDGAGAVGGPLTGESRPSVVANLLHGLLDDRRELHASRQRAFRPFKIPTTPTDPEPQRC